MNKDIDLILEGQEGRGAIYLSNQQAAKSLNLLKKYNIGAIINLTREEKLTHSKQDILKYLFISINDNDTAKISQYFDITYTFIEDARKVTNVLINCIAGISRSATILLAYMIKKYQYSLQTAFNIIKRKRDKINPNDNFMKQLKKFYLNTRKQKTQKSQYHDLKQQSQKVNSIKEDSYDRSVQFLKNKSKEFVSKTLQKSKMNFSQMLKSKLMLDDYNVNPKVIKKIQRLKTSIVTSLVFNDNQYNQQQKFSQLLKSKIYKNKEKNK